LFSRSILYINGLLNYPPPTQSERDDEGRRDSISSIVVENGYALVFSVTRRGSSRAAIALPVDEDAAIRFQDQLVTLDLHMRGNPYEQQSGGKTGGSWRLRDRAPWAVFNIQFDKHPIEPLRLRHVHRGYSCGRNIDAVR
jgi:hypothetical protein